MKNCSNAVRTTEKRNAPKEAQSGGNMKYCFKHNVNSVRGIAATARYVRRPEKNRHRRKTR